MGLEKIFLQLLNMSITAGYVIIAVLLIRLCIRRLPKIYSYVLWSIVAFRLLCPVSFSSAYSFFNLRYFDGMEKTEAGIQYVAMETDAEEEEIQPVMRNEQILPSAGASLDIAEVESERAEAVTPTNWKEVMPKVFSVIWVSGIGVLLIYTFFELARIRKQTADAVLTEGNIYESDRICQPFVFGMIHPRIYIPFRLQGQEREYILGHEQYHIRRKDYLVKGLAYGLAVVYWFHPLVWLAYYFMCQDMEMSCDEKVISSHGSEIKQSYGRLLLSFATEKKMLVGPLNFGESNAGKRIKNVLKYKKTGVAAALLGAALLVVLCLVFATNGKGGIGNRGTNSVMISTTDEQPVLSSTIFPEKSVKGDYSFGDEIESYLVYADIYKEGEYLGRQVIASHDMTAYQDGFSPLTNFRVNQEGGDTEGEQSSIAISYNTGMISRVRNIPIPERATMEAADILWEDGEQHEIIADKPYIYMAKYIGWGDMHGLECFRCENLNQADEEEWNRCINQECITVLLSFVFSEKPERELFKEYGDAEQEREALENAEMELQEKQEVMEREREAAEDLERELRERQEAIEQEREVLENLEKELRETQEALGQEANLSGELRERQEEIERKREALENAEEELRELQEALGQKANLSRVMDRIVEKYWSGKNGGHGGDYTWNDFLDECKRGNEDILWEDHLVYFDGAENGRADVYGVISSEFGTKGIIIDYKEKKGDDSNTNYFDWNWDASGFCPQIEMADFDGDGREEILFRLLGEKDPDLQYRERLFICETYETCTVVPYELTPEIIDEEIENLLEAEVIEDEHRVKISEKGTGRVLIPKLFYGYKGAGEYEKMSYASDWMIIDYVEDTHDIYLAMKPVVYVKYDSKLKEAYPTGFTTENEFLTFKIRYDESASLGSGYFTLSNPAMRRNLWE